MTNPMPNYGNQPMQPVQPYGGQPMQPVAPRPVASPQKMRDLSIISFVLSVCSLVALNLIGIGLGVLALIMSFKAERNAYRKLAFILSIVGISVCLIVWVMSLVTLGESRAMWYVWIKGIFSGAMF
ncbi:MAG: hypothetical protein IKS31_10095 [Clostridia bacterium]|nr:hypothetical protein [Clostridia bacterium]MBR4459295.1 hypothetical protein [Clostridia bacterium]